MDAEREVQRLLREHKAELIREGKHPVYRLPNGARFTSAKTPSDPRFHSNQLSLLRKLLDVNGRTNGDTAVDTIEQPTPADEYPTAEDMGLRPPAPPKSPMRLKIDSKIEALEARKRDLTVELAAIDTDLDKMTKLLVMVEDTGMEELISMLVEPETRTRRTTPMRRYSVSRIPGPEKSVSCSICGFTAKNKTGMSSHMRNTHPDAELESSQPQRITSPIQVTRQLVLAATQTFDGDFTTADVIERMAGDRDTSTQIRSAIGQLMTSLRERGEIELVKHGQGRMPNTWRRVDMTKLTRG